MGQFCRHSLFSTLSICSTLNQSRQLCTKVLFRLLIIFFSINQLPQSSSNYHKTVAQLIPSPFILPKKRPIFETVSDTPIPVLPRCLHQFSFSRCKQLPAQVFKRLQSLFFRSNSLLSEAPIGIFETGLQLPASKLPPECFLHHSYLEVMFLPCLVAEASDGATNSFALCCSTCAHDLPGCVFVSEIYCFAIHIVLFGMAEVQSFRSLLSNEGIATGRGGCSCVALLEKPCCWMRCPECGDVKV